MLYHKHIWESSYQVSNNQSNEVKANSLNNTEFPNLANEQNDSLFSCGKTKWRATNWGSTKCRDCELLNMGMESKQFAVIRIR